MHEKIMKKNYSKAFKTMVILAVFAFLIVRDDPRRVKYTV